MTHLDPFLLKAMEAAMPKEAQAFRSAERPILQKKIETLIEILHPDGYEAAEILTSLTMAVMRRYDNKLRGLDRVEEHHYGLCAAYEAIQDSEEGTNARDQY